MSSELIRLSSRLSLPARLIYVFFLVALTVIAVASLFEKPLPSRAEMALSLLLIVGAQALAPAYLRLFAFRETVLDGQFVVVRGVRRSWRIPVGQLGEIVTRTPKGWTMVRVALEPPVAGLGSSLRILGPFSEPSEYVAETLEWAKKSASRVGT